MPPVTVSFINMKGGVGKTTLAFNLAHFAAQYRDLSVLLVDLDPQANLSQYLLGGTRYLDYVGADEPTTAELFSGVVPPGPARPAPTPLEPSSLIVTPNPYQRWKLDLVPSRLELSRVLRNPAGKEDILAEFLANNASAYDLVVMDCPPTESVLTTAAYRASRYLMVPVRPEFLATVGFPMLARSLDEFRAGHANQSIDIAGVVFNGGRRTDPPREERTSIRQVRNQAEENGWYVFNHAVHESISFPRGSRSARPIFSTKFAREDLKDEVLEVGEEFLGRVGLSLMEKIRAGLRRSQ